MGIYHIVLFKLKDGVDNDQLKELVATLKGLVGQLPGLTSLEASRPLASSSTQGFNGGLVAVFENEEALNNYAEKTNNDPTATKKRAELFESTLVYDLAF